MTTAIAAQSANALNRGSATALSVLSKSEIAITPPTQKASAITWIAREPMARACEPLDAEWL